MPPYSLACTSMETYRFSRPARRLLAAAAVAVLLSGCGVRVGAPPAAVPSPDAPEELRQEAAVALERVALTAQTAAGADPEPNLAALIEVSTTYAEDLGGVWLPPPREEDPSPTSPAAAPVADADEREVLDVVLDSADTLLSVAAEDDSPEPEALISMWLTMHTAAVVLSADLGADCPDPCGAGMLPPALTEATASGDAPAEVERLVEAVPAQSPDLIGIYDAAGYVNEVRAARSSGEDREGATQRARELRRFADLLAGEAAGTSEDTRLSAYEIDLEDLQGSTERYAQAAAEHWLELYPRVPPEAREPLIEALWFAYASAHPDLQVGPWPALSR